MFGLLVAAIGFALLFFWKGASIDIAAQAAIELAQEFSMVAMAFLIPLGLYAAFKERHAKEMRDSLFWNDVHLGAGTDALGYLLLYAASRIVMAGAWLDPSWKEIANFVVTYALLHVAWHCFLAAASFFCDALLPARGH